jgi:hypothetical protein
MLSLLNLACLLVYALGWAFAIAAASAGGRGSEAVILVPAVAGVILSIMAIRSYFDVDPEERGFLFYANFVFALLYCLTLGAVIFK